LLSWLLLLCLLSRALLEQQRGAQRILCLQLCYRP